MSDKTMRCLINISDAFIYIDGVIIWSEFIEILIVYIVEHYKWYSLLVC